MATSPQMKKPKNNDIENNTAFSSLEAGFLTLYAIELVSSFYFLPEANATVCFTTWIAIDCLPFYQL